MAFRVDSPVRRSDSSNLVGPNAANASGRLTGKISKNTHKRRKSYSLPAPPPTTDGAFASDRAPGRCPGRYLGDAGPDVGAK